MRFSEDVVKVAWTSGLRYLEAEKPRIVLFCGKGGVGKTTNATATAMHFAKNGLKTLLFSSDPAPSLSDILEVDVKGVIKQVEGISNLEAVELDYDLVVEMWKKKYGREVFEVVSSFLPVGEDIIDYIAGAPGIDEEFALSYVFDLYQKDAYQVIVWDTAPAGGMLSLIKLEERLYKHLIDAARLYVRVRRAIDTLVKGRAKRDPLMVIREWEKLAQGILAMLRDEKTHAIVVTIAEALGLKQTERVIREFETFGIHIDTVLVNFLVTQDLCKCESHMQRAEMQREHLKTIQSLYGERFKLATLPQLPLEVRGITALEKVEKLLFGN